MMIRTSILLAAALMIGANASASTLANLLAENSSTAPASLSQEEGLPKVELFTPEAAADPVAETTVGMRAYINEIAIPGSELRAIPVADPGRAEVIVRVINVFNHGSDCRYNFEVSPLVEGTFDLRDFLERADGSSMDSVQEMPVIVDAVTEESLTLPNDLDVPHPEKVGGYRDLLIGLGILWGLGLVCLIFLGHGKRRAAAGAGEKKPLSLAERLRPLVERAGQGDLSNGERAELERLVIAHWRGRRDLSGATVAEAVTSLRQDEEAGPLLVKLEEWFHSPRPADLSETEIQELLRPYGAVSTAGSFVGSTSGGAA